MQASEVDEADLFRAVAGSGARALLFGRRALIALGLPVGTFDYDFWIHIDDAGLLNRALGPLGLHPNRTPEEARAVGRYVLEDDLRVDVLVARAVPPSMGSAWCGRRSGRDGSSWRCRRASASRSPRSTI